MCDKCFAGFKFILPKTEKLKSKLVLKSLNEKNYVVVLGYGYKIFSVLLFSFHNWK